MYKVNWDVAINSTLRIMGVGIIVRDHMGQVHAASSKTIHSVQEPVVAEAMGALLVTGFCRDLGIQEIEMEGDSLQVVRAIRDPDTQRNSHGHLTGDTR
jgi:ribonuclease HI